MEDKNNIQGLRAYKGREIRFSHIYDKDIIGEDKYTFKKGILTDIVGNNLIAKNPLTDASFKISLDKVYRIRVKNERNKDNRKSYTKYTTIWLNEKLIKKLIDNSKNLQSGIGHIEMLFLGIWLAGFIYLIAQFKFLVYAYSNAGLTSLIPIAYLLIWLFFYWFGTFVIAVPVNDIQRELRWDYIKLLELKTGLNYLDD